MKEQELKGIEQDMIIPWLIILTLLMIGIQGMVYSKWGLSRIQYTRSFGHRAVFEGEETEMIEVITNHKWLPVPWLRVESRMSTHLQFQKQFNLDIKNQQFHRSLFSLMPFQKITRRHRVTCTKRGYYGLDTIAITGGDPFGFGQNSQTLNVSVDILVYPKLIPMTEIPLPSHSWQGDLIVRRWIVEDPFTFAGVREYAPGDSLNGVNWKATARVGDLQVNQKSFTADHHLMIYLSFDLQEDIWMPVTDQDLMEKGISYAASIAQHAILQGINTGFGSNSYLADPTRRLDEVKEPIRVDPQNSKSHMTGLLDTMARLTMDRSISFNRFLEQDVKRNMSNTDILLITPFLSDNIRGNIRKLESQGNTVEILWLKQEKDKHHEETLEAEAHVQ